MTKTFVRKTGPLDEKCLVHGRNQSAIGRSTTKQASTASIDSVLSYTGRIAFQTTPEVITFIDDPNEDRGTHYTRIGRKDNLKTKASSSKPKSRNPCTYYTLCCIMIIIPAAVLIVLFVVVLD